MRRLTTALAISFSISSAFAQQQTSAYEALKVMAEQLGRAALNHVVSVGGVDGDPQPKKWIILLADKNAPGGIHEIQVANGRVVANKAPHGVVGSSANAAFSANNLNLDSTGAFQVASHTADQAHVNFDRVAYTLRTNERGEPVWIITLQDQARRPLGTIQINANRGNVVRVEGMYHGANMAHVEQDRSQAIPNKHVENVPPEDEYADSSNDTGIEEGDEDENVVKRRMKAMFHRTKESAAGMFHRVRRSFADFIAGDRD